MGREGRPAREIRLPAKLRDDVVELPQKKAQKVYCLCRQPYEEGEFMIACDANMKSPDCLEWCHGACVGISPQEARRIQDYICPACDVNASSTKRKRTGKGDNKMDKESAAEDGTEVVEAVITGNEVAFPQHSGSPSGSLSSGGEDDAVQPHANGIAEHESEVILALPCGAESALAPADIAQEEEPVDMNEMSEGGGGDVSVKEFDVATKELTSMTDVDPVSVEKAGEATVEKVALIMAASNITHDSNYVTDSTVVPAVASVTMGIDEVPAAIRAHLSVKRQAEESLPRAASLQRTESASSMGSRSFRTEPLSSERLASPRPQGMVSPRSGMHIQGTSWTSSKADLDSPKQLGSSPGGSKQKACAYLGCEKLVTDRQWYCSNECEKAAEKETLAKKRMRETTVNSAANKRRLREVIKPAPRTVGVFPSGNLAGAGNRVVENSQVVMRQKLRDSLAAALALVTETVSDNTGVTSVKASDSVEAIGNTCQEISSNAIVQFSENIEQSESIEQQSAAVSSVEIEQGEGLDMLIAEGGGSVVALGEQAADTLTAAGELSGPESGAVLVKAEVEAAAAMPSAATAGPLKLEQARTIEELTELFELKKKAAALAAEIENEMYTVFGGASKKYRERARSLLFNLKDRANPELRQRVMSGEIAPQALCLMTAEQLASRELAEWRTAKAEEHALQVVLPSEDAMWRVVKKTHKGEVVLLQREETMDVPIDAAIAGGLSSSRLPISSEPSKQTGIEGKTQAVVPLERMEESATSLSEVPSKHNSFEEGQAVKEESKLREEGKREAKLPAIMSLDEYMEARTGSRKSPVVVQEDFLQDQEATPPSSPSAAPELDLPSPTTPRNRKTIAASIDKEEWLAKKENREVWQGRLQFGSAGLCRVRLEYRSGERLPVKDCLEDLVEVKGRVKYAEMEGFLASLQSSRARAVMVVGILASGKSEEQINQQLLQEAAEQYRESERVGFAELEGGGELYFLPWVDDCVDLLRRYGYLLPLGEGTATGGELLVGAFIRRRSRMPSWFLQRSETEAQGPSSADKEKTVQTPVKTSSPRPTKPSSSKPNFSLPPGFEGRKSQGRGGLSDHSGSHAQGRVAARDPRRRMGGADEGSPVEAGKRRSAPPSHYQTGHEEQGGFYGGVSERSGTGRQAYVVAARGTAAGGGGGSIPDTDDLPEFNFETGVVSSGGPLPPPNAAAVNGSAGPSHGVSQQMLALASAAGRAPAPPLSASASLGPLPRTMAPSCLTQLPATHVLGAPWHHVPDALTSANRPPESHYLDPSNRIFSRMDGAAVAPSWRPSAEAALLTRSHLEPPSQVAAQQWEPRAHPSSSRSTQAAAAAAWVSQQGRGRWPPLPYGRDYSKK